MKNVSQQEWRSLLETDTNAVIIDVRTPDEWEDGIQENAQLINVQDPNGFMDAIAKVNKEKNFYVYCRSGGRSEMACQILETTGIKSTYNLEGGMMAWNGTVVKP